MLPGIDDGPADASETSELLQALGADGVQVVAATHHFRSDYPGVTAEVVREGVAGIAQFVPDGAKVPTVVAGAEVGLDWILRASDDDLRLATYGQLGKDLLLETPSGPLPPQFHDVLFRLKAKGLRVTLAHPERSRSFQEQPRRLSELVLDGVLLQVNASSLLSGKRGSRTRSLAFALIDEEVAHLIASDAHSAHWRAPLMSTALQVAEARVGPRARWMVTAAPAAVLAGAPLPPAPRSGKKSLFGGLRRR